MSEPFIEINPEEAISEIINCLSNGKTSKSLKNDFEFVSTNSVNEQDEHLCKFFVDKANDGFFDMNKASIKYFFDILLSSEKPIYYFTAYILSHNGIYTEEDGKKYYTKCLDAKYLPSIICECERLAKSEKDKSKVFDFCVLHKDSNDAILEFYIGILTYFGMGTKKDQQSGKNYLEKSACKGYNPAIVILTAIYSTENQDYYTKCISHLNQKNDINLSFKSYYLTEASKMLWEKISSNTILRPLFKDFEMMMLVSKNPQFLQYTNDSTSYEISDHLFENDNNLKSIFIPSKVRKINKNAFKNCSNLESIEFGPDSSLEEIGEKSFYNCISLQALNLPKSVKIIGISSFENNKSLSKLELNEGLKTISNRSFANCISLKKLQIPSSLENLNESCFCECVSLEFLEFSVNSNLKNIGDYAFHSASLQTIDFPASVTTTGMFSFHYCSKLTTVSFKNIETIGKGTFHSCEGLCSVNIEGSTLKTIGEGSFYSCAKLNEINFQSNSILESIGKCAFQNCVALKSFNFQNVKFIGELSFYGCNSLTEIEIPGTIKVVEDQSFEACEFLKNVILDEGVEIIGERCFYLCLNLEKVSLPKTVKEINSHAFDGCINLSEINVDKDSTTIGENAFFNCTKLGH